MSRTDKPLVWLRGEIKTPAFSLAARQEVGMLLRRLQMGEIVGVPHSRPMPSVGPRCHELRVRDENTNWRILHRIDEDAVVILDVFAKKTRQTPQTVIHACQQRLAGYDR